MSAALEFLTKTEWTMGNGQCGDCCGLGESFVFGWGCGGRDSWGHELMCPRAKAIESIGGNPFYKSTFAVYPMKDKIFEKMLNQRSEIVKRIRGKATRDSLSQLLNKGLNNA